MSEIRDVYRIQHASDVQELLAQINAVLARVGDRLDKAEGLRGTPEFHASPDLKGNSIENVKSARKDSDGTNLSDITRAVQRMWPVGSIFLSVVSTNPKTLLGFGTWELFGAGKMMICLDDSDSSFDTVEATGGAKTVDISHVHTIDHVHGAGTAAGTAAAQVNDTAFAGNSGSGGSTTLDILNPYIVAYRWKRTA